jgi:hypothetical protein
VSDCIFFACFPSHRLAQITEDDGILWALPYSSATRAAQFQGSQACCVLSGCFVALGVNLKGLYLQGDEISDIVKEMDALPQTSKLRQVNRKHSLRCL